MFLRSERRTLQPKNWSFRKRLPQYRVSINFLENQEAQYREMAPQTVFVQAKTYYGDGKWYTLDIDYDLVAKILREQDYRGYISLEFEGKEDYETAIPKSLKRLREAFA